MKPGILLYKCRLCGRIDISTHSPDIVKSIMYTIIEMDHPTPNQKDFITSKYGIHHCSDGGLGVTDLIGGSEDKNEN